MDEQHEPSTGPRDVEAVMADFVGRNPGAAATLEAMTGFLARRGVTVETAAVADLEAYRAHLRRAYPSSTFYRHAGWARDLYHRLVDAQRVTREVAIAAGVDPLAISPDRDALLACIRRHNGDHNYKPALARLNAYFLRRGSSPLAAEPAQREAFMREGLRGLSRSSRATYAGIVRRFYREQDET